MKTINLAHLSLALAVLIITWTYPVKVASALLQEPKPQEIQLTQSVNEQVLGSNTQPKTLEDVSSKSRKAVKSSHDVNTPKSGSNETAYGGRHYSSTEVQDLIRQYSAQHGIEADTPLCIASKESGFNQFSKNKSSTASGIYQYLRGTFASTPEGKAGLSVFDADANVRAAVRHMAVHKDVTPWVVWRNCPPLKFIN